MFEMPQVLHHTRGEIGHARISPSLPSSAEETFSPVDRLKFSQVTINAGRYKSTLNTNYPVICFHRLFS